MTRTTAIRPRPRPSSSKRFLSAIFFWDTVFWLTDSSFAGDGRAVPDGRENFRHFTSHGVHRPLPEGERIAAIEVYLGITSPAASDSPVFGRATALKYYTDLALPSDSAFASSREHEIALWSRLERDVDYSFDTALGLLHLSYPLYSQHGLAVAFSLTSGDTFGTLPATADSAALVLLRPGFPQPGDATWNLMARNVYPLTLIEVVPMQTGSACDLRPDRYRLRIFHRETGSGLTATPPSQSTPWLSYFGPDEEGGPDGRIDNLPAFVCWTCGEWYHGELYFPDLTPFDPSGYWEGDTFIRRPLSFGQHGDSTGWESPEIYIHTQSRIAVENIKHWQFTAEIDTSLEVAAAR